MPFGKFLLSLKNIKFNNNIFYIPFYKIEGKWSSWSEWSECDEGIRIRTRSCNLANCQGDEEQEKVCKKKKKGK